MRRVTRLRLAFASVLVSCAPVAAEPPELRLPVDCEVGRTCEIQHYVDADPSSGVRDYHCGARTYDAHNGTDIRLPNLAVLRRGVAVQAAADGRVLRVRDGVSDVSTRGGGPPIEGRECGNGVVVGHADGWETQYCHLAQDSVRVKPGEEVRAGQAIGLVGLSGQTEFPHLHFTVRRNGTVIDPFAHEAAVGQCPSGRALWSTALQGALAYKPRIVLNAGFAAGPVSNEAIESDAVRDTPPRRDGPALVAFVRMIGGQAGDVATIEVKGPDGTVLVTSAAEPLDRQKAQTTQFAGKRTPPGGWASGAYEARYRVVNAGVTVLSHSFRTEF